MDSSNIKVSVVIPCYNAMPWLTSMLDSVLAQTLSPIEIICVDDGSTDNTLDVLREYEQKQGIIVISQQNLYAGVARNSGMAIAKGDYITFWDADDLYHADYLSTMYGLIISEEADIAVCQGYDLDTKSNVTTKKYNINFDLTEGEKVINRQKASRLFQVYNLAPWNKLFRLGFLKENELLFSDSMKSNDLTLDLQSKVLAKRIALTEKRLFTRRSHIDTSITNRMDEYPYSSYYECLKVKKFLEAEKLLHELEETFQICCFDCMEHMIRMLKDKKIIQEVWQFIQDSYITTFGLDRLKDEGSSKTIKVYKMPYEDVVKKARLNDRSVVFYGAGFKMLDILNKYYDGGESWGDCHIWDANKDITELRGIKVSLPILEHKAPGIDTIIVTVVDTKIKEELVFSFKELGYQVYDSLEHYVLSQKD